MNAAVVKILVVDDEELARHKICRFLEELPTQYDVHQAENGLQAIKKIHCLQPDIIFLDVEMPSLGGFECLAQIEQRHFQVVFQTAYNEFAIRAFEENACDYLLKPFDRNRFLKALQRAQSRQSDETQRVAVEKLFLTKHQYLKNVVVKIGNTYDIVPTESIHCFTSLAHHTYLHTSDGESVCDLSLTHLEERLNPKQFLRLHRNSLVNLKEIATVSNGDSCQVTLRSGQMLAVSRRQRQILREHLLAITNL